jgi:hypothetical protein
MYSVETTGFYSGDDGVFGVLFIAGGIGRGFAAGYL